MSEHDLRVQVELSPERAAALTALMHRLGLKSKKDLLNNAISMLEWAASEIAKGKDVASVDLMNKSFEVLKMPALDHVRGTPN